MTWLEEVIEALSGGYENTCQTHDSHDTKKLSVNLGPFSGVEMHVYDWRQYANTLGYCSGDDEVSKSLDVNMSWEPYGLTIAAELVRRNAPDGMVVDLGAHVGCYSLVAAYEGRQVLAVDADPEHVKTLVTNCHEPFDHLVYPVRGWIGDETPEISVHSQRIRLLKIDIEGNEGEALRVFDPHLRGGLVDTVLMEVSPVFNDTYPGLAQRLVDYGYDAYLVPDMADVALDEFTASDAQMNDMRIRNADLQSRIADMTQRDILFMHI